jgi:hypothetical protein
MEIFRLSQWLLSRRWYAFEFLHHVGVEHSDVLEEHNCVNLWMTKLASLHAELIWRKIFCPLCRAVRGGLPHYNYEGQEERIRLS